MMGLESTEGIQHPDATAAAWGEFAEGMNGAGGLTWQDLGREDVAQENALGMPTEEHPLSSRDDNAHAERYQEERDSRLAAENQERMKQSEAELEEFQRKLQLSPEAYWQELKNEYAQNGVNLGLMPDMREMRGYAQDYLAQKVGEGDQRERVNVALKTELQKMAQSKAAEIQRWQSEGRGLPITFESEWLETGRKDMGNLLSGYYGGEGRLNEEARQSGKLTEDEKVAWQMAELPHKPGTLNPTWVFQSNPGKFEGETMVEYYNRLKNYRSQDQMRDWQVKQDLERSEVEKKEDEAESVAAKPQGKPAAIAYDLGGESLALQDTRTGEWKVLKPNENEKLKAEAEQAKEQWERDPEGVAEAIAITDAEIAERQEERERLSREELTERVKKKPGFIAAVKRMATKFLDWMRLEDTSEEDEAYYAEMERQEKEEAERKSFDPELWKMTNKSGLEPVFEEEQKAAEIAEGNSESESAKANAVERKGVDISLLTPEKVEQLLMLKRRAEIALASDESLADPEERRSIMENYGKIAGILNRYEKEKGLEELIEYQTMKGLEGREKVEPTMAEVIELAAEKETESVKENAADEEGFTGEFNFTWLQQRNLISGDKGEKGIEELRTLKDETDQAVLKAIWDDEETAIAEYRQRLMAIKRAMEWLEQENEANSAGEGEQLAQTA